MKKYLFVILSFSLVACGMLVPGTSARQPTGSSAFEATSVSTMRAIPSQITGTPAILSGIPVASATALPHPTSTATESPFVAVWFSLDQNVNCRKGPNTFYKVVHVLKAGERVAIAGRTDPGWNWGVDVWLQIRLPASQEACWVTVAAGHADGNLDLVAPQGFPAQPDLAPNFKVSSSCPDKGHTRTIQLSWGAVKNVTGYALYRRRAYDDEQLLATLPADSISFTDEVRPDYFYTYELASLDQNAASDRVAGWVDMCK